MSKLLSLCRDRRKLAKVLITAAGVSVVLGLAAVFLLYAVLDASSAADLPVYLDMMRGGFHPIWKDLVLHRVRKNDPLAEAIRKHSPTRRREIGPFTVLWYDGKGAHRAQIQMVAANGVLIRALASCSAGMHVFFESPLL